MLVEFNMLLVILRCFDRSVPTLHILSILEYTGKVVKCHVILCVFYLHLQAATDQPFVSAIVVFNRQCFLKKKKQVKS
jgi:hypothetical protein